MTETNDTTIPVIRMARENKDFRRVVMTGDQTQVVLMSIPQGEEIGGEVHEGHDQLLIFVEGSGKAVIGGATVPVGKGDLSFVPSGTFHNFKNDGSGPLKLFTTYSPPEHEAGEQQQSKT